MKKYKKNIPSNVCHIEDNNVDYDNNSISAMRLRIAKLEEENKHLKLCRCCECQSENEYMLQGLVSDLEEENKQLKALLNSDDKMKTNSLAGFMKLYEKNAKLKVLLKKNIEDLCEFMNYITDCTYIREPDYSNLINYIDNLVVDARKQIGDKCD